MRFHNTKSRGFTLIELLVVIAIIAILAAILFPVFARARENARRASCQSNLKQLALGIQQYTQDYDERMPLQGMLPDPAGSWWKWGQNIMPYIKSTQVFECPSFTNPRGTKDATFGLVTTLPSGALSPYHYGLLTSYGMNVQLMPNTNTGFPISQFTHPSEVVMLADDARTAVAGETLGQLSGPNASVATDGCYATFYDNSFGIPTYDTAGLSACGPHARHLGTANVAFADGHVKAMKYDTLYNVPSTVSPDTNWKLWYPTAP